MWGHLPEIYWASGARPATRFLSSGFYLGDWGGRPPGNRTADVPTPGARVMLMSDLRVRPPRFILDTTPASIRGSQFHPMSSIPPFDKFVKHGYRYVRTIDGIAVYERSVSARVAASAIPPSVVRAG